jgi:HK97 family phage portal protein
MNNPFRLLFERKSDAVSSSYELARLIERGARSVAGTDVTDDTAFRVAAVLTCVSLVSRVIATFPLKVYERSADGKSKMPAVKHPLSQMLAQPNPWQTRSELIEMLQAHLMLRGNAYAWKNVTTNTRDGSKQIQELMPLHPDRVKVEQRRDWSLSYTVIQGDGTTTEFPANEIVHLRGLSSDGIVGRSVLQDARDVIGIAQATQNHAGSYWAGGGVPDIALRHPRALGDKARKNLEESAQKTYGSDVERRRWIVLEEGMEIEPISINAEDAQFLETRKFTRGEIAGLFHVPPHLIGDTEKSTSWGTGIEQQTIGWVNFGLRPWLVKWEQRMDLDLLFNRDRFFTQFSVDGLLRGDSTSRGTFYRTMREIGAFSVNDVRALENYNPVTGGDDYRPLALGKQTAPDASSGVDATDSTVKQGA